MTYHTTHSEKAIIFGAVIALTLAIILTATNFSITGFATKSTAVTQTEIIGREFNSATTYIFEKENLTSLSLTGNYTGNSSFTVYIETENGLLEIYTYEPKESKNLLTGMVTGEPAEEYYVDLLDNNTNISVENITTNETPYLNITLNETINETINETANENNIDRLNETNTTINETDSLEVQEIVEETPTEIPSQREEAAPEGEAQAPKTKPLQVHSFTSACIDTCSLPPTNTTRLVIDIDYGTLYIESAEYTTIQTETIPEEQEGLVTISVGETENIDFSKDYKEKGLFFDMSSSEGYTYTVNEYTVSITGTRQGEWPAQVYVLDGESLERINLTINVTPSLNQTINETINETNETILPLPEVRYAEEIQLQNVPKGLEKKIRLIDTDNNGLLDAADLTEAGLQKQDITIRKKDNVRAIDEYTDEITLAKNKKLIRYDEQVNEEEGGKLKAKETGPSPRIAAIKIQNEKGLYADIGNEYTGDFEPRFTLAKWDADAVLDIELEIEDPQTIETYNDTINLTYTNKTIQIYSLEPDNINEDGGLRFDVVLNEIPETNEFSFNIDSQNLEFHYQPPLNEEYNNPDCSATECGGARRPENVVGSYAVYHSTKKDNDYKTGKAFHIYRPKIFDAAGNEIWGDLNIDNGLLKIQIPQEFLDTAIYPVTIDPTFGFTSAGASTEITNGIVSGSNFTGAEGTVTKITAYLLGSGSTGVRAGIYKGSDSTIVSNSSEVVPAASALWNNFTLPNATITQQEYVVAVFVDNAGIDVEYYFDTLTNGGRQDYDTYSSTGTLTSPATFSTTNQKYSVYATYLPNYFFYDEFSDVDDTELINHQPDLGSGWEYGEQRSSGKAGIVSNRIGPVAALESNTGFIILANDTVPSADYNVTITATNLDSTDDTTALVARWQDEDNYYAWFLSSSLNYGITKVYGGTSSQLNTSDCGAPGDGSVLALSVRGTNISIYDDGTLLCSAIDTSITAAGRGGFGHGANIVNQFGDHDIQQTDNFYIIYVEEEVVIETTLNTPADGTNNASTDWNFTATIIDDEEVINATLYTNESGTWAAKETRWNGEIPYNDTGLVLLLHFNNESAFGENTTVAIDFSGNDNNAAIGSDAFINNTAGKFGSSMNFLDVSDPVIVQSDSTLNLLNFTVSAWVISSSAGAWEPILNRYDGSTHNFYLGLDGDSMPYVEYNNYISAASSTDFNSLSAGWHHLVGTYNGSSLIIYVDGINEGETVDTTPPETGDVNISIGKFSGNYWSGSIDEVAIWNRSLSATEVAALYNYSKTSFKPVFQERTLTENTYLWNVLAYDNDSNSDWGDSNYTLIVLNPVPSFSNFNGSTTNFSALSRSELESLENPTLEITNYGKITWTDTINVTKQDFDTHVIIGYNTIYVDSSSVDSSLNTTANLTMYNLPYSVAPDIYKNGEICATCEVISYSNGTLLFNTTSFSNFTTNGTINTTLVYPVDSTESETQIWPFYANITGTRQVANATLYTNESGTWAAKETRWNGEIPYNDTGLVLLYHMNNESGFGENGTLLYDWSGNNNDATVDCSTTCPIYAASGKFGSAYTLDNSKDLFALADNDYFTGLDEMTVMAWVKPLVNQSTIGDSGDLVSKRHDGTSGTWNMFYIRIGTANRLEFLLSNSTDQLTAAGATNSILAGEWTHVVGRYNGSNIDTFINGEEDTTGAYPFTGTIINSVGDFYLGFSNYNGTIDEVAFYDRALTDEEILDIYNYTKSEFLPAFHERTLTPGEYIWNVLGEDNETYADWGDSNYTLSIIDGTPSITLTYPADSTTGSNTTWPFASSTTDNQEIINATLYTNESGTWAAKETRWTGEIPYNDTNLVALYHFNNQTNYGESNTNVYDWSGNGNNGTPSGTNPLTEGIFGYALNSTATSGMVVSNDQSLNLTANITITAWVNPGDNPSTYARIVDKGYDLAYFLGTDQTSSGLALSVWLNNNEVAITSDVLTMGEWQQVAMTYNGSNVAIYYNGVLMNSTSYAGGIPGSTYNLEIGSRADAGGGVFNGSIDEVAIWNRTLSSSEILALYNYTKDTFNPTFINRTLSGGTYIWNVQAYDNESNLGWASSNYTLTVETMADPNPNVTLVYPAQSTTSVNTAWNFTSNVTDSTEIINATLYTNESGTWEAKETRWNGEIPYNDTGLVALWHFNNESAYGENDTNAIDWVGDYNATPYNTNWYPDIGKFGGAYNLTLTGDFINLSNNFEFADNFTLSFWAYRTQHSGNAEALFHKEYHFYIGWNADNQTFIQQPETPWDAVDYGAPLNNNEWYHFVVVHNDTDDWVMYVNGAEYISGPMTMDGTAGGEMSIGAIDYGYLDNEFGGIIDEVAIWDRTLNSTEVLELYNYTKDSFSPAFQERTLTEGKYIWNVEAYDDASNVGWATNNYTLTLASGFFYDTFTDTNGVELTAHTPDIGSGWEYGEQRGSGQANITSNRVGPLSSDAINSGFIILANDTVPTPDYNITITATNLDSSDDMTALVARWQDSNNYYAWFLSSTTNRGIYKIYQSAATQINTSDCAVPSDGSVLTLSVVGTNISIYDDGTLLCSATDTTIAAAGRGGFGHGAMITDTVGEISIQQTDNFMINYTDTTRVLLSLPENSDIVPAEGVDFTTFTTDGTNITNATLYTNESGSWAPRETRWAGEIPYNDTGLVALWHFNNESAYRENNTNIIDWTGNNNNITQFNGDITTASSLIGKGLSMDGYGDYAYITKASSLNFSETYNFTVALWAYNAWALNDSWTQHKYIIDDYYSNATYYAGFNIYYDQSGLWRFGIGNGTARILTASSDDVPPNTWTHITGVYNGTHISIYINGTYEGASTVYGTVKDNNEATIILSADTTYGWNGTIDEIGIWNRALSNTEIMNLYNYSKIRLVPSFQTRDLSIGEYIWNVQAYDSSGNSAWGEANYSFTVVEGLPNTTLIYPPNATADTASSWSFVANATDETEIINMTLYTNETGTWTAKETRWTGEIPYNDTNLLVLLHFNNETAYGENNTHAYDWSGNNNNATLGNINIQRSMIGYGANLDSTGAYMQVENQPEFDQLPITISLWVNLTTLASSTGNAFYLAELLNNPTPTGNAPWVIWVEHTNDRVYFAARDTADGYQGSSSTTVLTTGTPYHIVYRINESGTMNLFINGAKETGSDNVGADIKNGTGPLMIGAHSTAGSFRTRGTIDEFTVWNRALSDEEIAALYDYSLTESEPVFQSRTLTRGDYLWNVQTYDSHYNEDWGDNNYTLTVSNNPPVVSGVILNATSSGNYSSDNLTLYFTQSDADGDTTYNVTDWRVNGTSIAVLNMPFNTEFTSTSNTTAGVTDYSTYQNNGYLGNSTSGTQPTWTTEGKIGGAYLFDGSNDYIEADDSNVTSIPPFTASAWINHRSGNGSIINKYVSGLYNGFMLFVRSDKVCAFSYRNSTNYVALTDPDCAPINQNEWYHVSTTIDASGLSLYINGQLNKTVSWTGTYGSSNSPMSLLIGAYHFSGGGLVSTYFFNGTIDEVQIYNRSLSSEQIYQIYSAGLNNHSIDLISREETNGNDNWDVCITASDGYETSDTECSENISIKYNTNLTIIYPTTTNKRTTISGGILNISYNLTVDEVAKTTGITLNQILLNGSQCNLTYTEYDNYTQFYDSFTDSNSVYLQAHTPDTGTGWQEVYESGGSVGLYIQGNTVLPSSNGNSRGSIYKINTTPLTENYTLRLTATDVDDAHYTINMYTRWLDSNNHYAFRFSDNVDTINRNCQLYKRVSGVDTNLNTSCNGVNNPSDGDIITFKVQGNSIELSWDGSVQMTATDTSLTAAGVAAIGLGASPEFTGDGMDDQVFDNVYLLIHDYDTPQVATSGNTMYLNCTIPALDPGLYDLNFSVNISPSNNVPIYGFQSAALEIIDYITPNAQRGEPTYWEWNNDTGRLVSGSPTSWNWLDYSPASGRQVRNGTATNWTWIDE